MTRRVACTCACVVLLTARSAQAQHAPAKPAAPPAEAQAHPQVVAASPVKPPEGHGAPAAPPAVHSETPAKNAKDVKDAKDAHSAPKAAAPAATTPKSPSIATAVERIQQRMAEVSTPAPGRGRAAGAASSIAAPKPRRIYLDWRAPLVWPAELVGAESQHPLSHITLTWSIK